MSSEFARMVGPEWRILLSCAAADATTPELEALVAREDVDWLRLRGAAARERALRSFWSVLRGAPRCTLPAEERQTWQGISMVSDFRSQYMEDRLRQTLGVLAARGIDVVVLKGAALALSVYGGFAEREMGDIDLLVPADRASEAFDVVRGAGWRWDEGAYPAARYREHHHLPPLRDGRDAEARLELHTRLSPEGHPLAHTFGELRDQGMLVPFPVPQGEGKVWMLSHPAQLVHVAVHFAWSHQFTFGVWRAVRDTRRLLLHLQGREDETAALARRLGVTACLFWTLHMAREFAGVQEGERLERLVAPPFGKVRLSYLRRHHAQSLFRFGGGVISERWRRMMWESTLRPDLAGREGIRPWLVMEPGEESVTEASPRKREGVPWSIQARRLRLLAMYVRGVLTGSAGGARG